MRWYYGVIIGVLGMVSCSDSETFVAQKYMSAYMCNRLKSAQNLVLPGATREAFLVDLESPELREDRLVKMKNATTFRLVKTEVDSCYVYAHFEVDFADTTPCFKKIIKLQSCDNQWYVRPDTSL